MLTKSAIATLFYNFSVRECKGSSELYEHLALKVSEDETLLQLASYSKPGQPVPNLLFGTVHYLLLKGHDHPLNRYYESVTENAKKNMNDAFEHFKDFCEIHRSEIITMLQTKLVQTNEVRRCAYLYPSFCYIYNKVKRPLALIEIGTSAGLQLFWDEYHYSYGTEEMYGNKDGNVHLQSEVKGEEMPSLSQTSPPVIERIGLDLHVNDLRDEEDYFWLRSLIWPEHKERLQLFDRAAAHVKDKEFTLVEGDGVALLPEVAKHISKEAAICIFHTHVANQIPEDIKQKLVEQVKALGAQRDVFHLYNNMWDRNLHLDSFIDGKEYNETIAETDGHARWFHWKVAGESFC
ncbi:DUF2332 domain-containing protein [Bacillus manliponensis]|uniref:DUF2332 domain-containing protein n=1 Tax=Bacillus manliponensis TaxID=574376 RepID=UPI0035139F27